MKLIGVGLPRTATLTQKVALEMLGFGPCYHMVNVLGNLDLVPVWRDALNGQADWPQVFEGFESTVDWPGSYYYKELIDVWPDAKVLLSVRDPQSWERSINSTIVDCLQADSLTCRLSQAAGHINPKWSAYNELMIEMWTRFGVFDGHGGTGDLPAIFERFSDEVKQNVPAERLLIWQPADGWDPLCEFLGVEVPDQPLPQTNDSETFGSRLQEMSVGTINEWWQAQRAQSGEPAAAAH